MSTSNDALSLSLQTGFIDQAILSNLEFRPELILNDKVRRTKVLTTLISELHSCDEFRFSVAFVTASGIATLRSTLELLEKKPVYGTILVSQYLNFTQPEALRSLLKFKNIKLKIAVTGNYHSKGYLFRRGSMYDLIVGSSNLTDSALSVNHELNLKISATNKSGIIAHTLSQFNEEFKTGKEVDEEYISSYESDFYKQAQLNRKYASEIKLSTNPVPNEMQFEALDNLKKLRNENKTKALLIAATGTGKTYLSAFDAKLVRAKKLLFVVHRQNIAQASLVTYAKVFGKERTLGIYSGGKKESDANFIFSTIQTISKEEHRNQFDPHYFDYIVIDESHRAGAATYDKIVNYFKPKFLLGMTATPERMDGQDIFKLFDNNIAAEIRLQRALEEGMVSTFHYYGIKDITVGEKVLVDRTDFLLLTSEERVNRIIEKTKFYGCDNGIIRGLVFCSRVEECKELSIKFNLRGLRSVYLTKDSTEMERSEAISQLQSDNLEIKLEYIFTVEIFNEGVDIPRVNQIILLRPTQSAIVFVQQLGRGLRKVDDKEYLTVIDFIGNYSNNYLIPIALFGDTSYNKDTLRKLLACGSAYMPGASTVNFDQISRKQIFDSIDSANMHLYQDLVKDYLTLRRKLGRAPLMIDFLEHGSRDPYMYVKQSGSYYQFVQKQELDLKSSLNEFESILLELLSCEINNSKRFEESVILKELIECGFVDLKKIKKMVLQELEYLPSDSSINSCLNNLNLEFNRYAGKAKTVLDRHFEGILVKDGQTIKTSTMFLKVLENATFKRFLMDSIDYSIRSFKINYSVANFVDGFVLYRKYSRRDVFRILNWEKNPVGLNVGGYLISSDKLTCPIFVNYFKDESISSTTKYEDKFINQSEFEWMSKSGRTKDSSDVKVILNDKKIRLPLFIKKYKEEDEFYYVGDVTPKENSSEQKFMDGKNGRKSPVVKLIFELNRPLVDHIYSYMILDVS